MEADDLRQQNAHDIIRQLIDAMGAFLDAVGDMPSDPAECWPSEYAACEEALDRANIFLQTQ